MSLFKKKMFFFLFKESIIDVPFESYQRSQTELNTRTSTVESCNTDHETINYTSVKSVITPKDTASCFFTEVNECDSLPQQQIGRPEGICFMHVWYNG